MNLVVDGLMTSYSVSGKGKTLLLLHGWGDSSKSFEELSKHFDNKYKVISLDLPGFGGTQTPEEVFNLQKYAQFVASFLAKIEEENVFAVIGHSNGGAIALKALSMKIMTADKLVLLASSGIRSTYKARKKALRIAAKVAKVPITLLSKSTQAKIKKKAYKKIGSDLFVAEHMQETFKNVVSEDILNQISSVETDSLLLYGDQDTATPVEYGKKIQAALRHAKLEILQGADHFSHQTHTETLASLVNTFLEDK